MDRADDPDLAEKMKAEAEGIFLWAVSYTHLNQRTHPIEKQHRTNYAQQQSF